MAFPPAVLPVNFTNATPQVDTHPAAHNALAQAVNDITAHVKPAGRLLGYVTGLPVFTADATARDIPGAALSFTAVAGRRYTVRAQAGWGPGPASGTILFFNIADLTGTSLVSTTNTLTVNYYQAFTAFGSFANWSGAVTVKLRVNTNAATVALANAFHLELIDYGTLT